MEEGPIQPDDRTITQMDEHRGDPVTTTFQRLQEEIRSEVVRHKRRADEAEKRLAAAEFRLAALKHELDAARSEVHGVDQRMVRGIEEYISETTKSQRTLLSLVRQLLGVRSDEAEVEGPSPQADEAARSGAARSGADGTTVRPSDASYTHPSSGPPEIRVETTDEHRLIDLSNQADMDRLGARSRFSLNGPAAVRLKRA